ncbi:MAG: hypothetical protein GY754_39460 [bacterium]|nr:hypothetical protein [bacterium]
MRSKKLLIIIPLIVIFSTINIYPRSETVKSYEDYRLVLDALRKLKIMIENFPNDENTAQYKKLKADFKKAGIIYYGQHFIKAHKNFVKIKGDMVILLEKVSNEYIEATKSLLNSTSKEAFEIMINFSKHSTYATYFYKPYDPMVGLKPYSEKFNETHYHYFRDREKIERYIKNGYKNLEIAKNRFNDPEIKYLKERKNRTSKHLDIIISNYLAVIKSCRLAKQLGIEIHKIRNVHKLGDILKKYRLNFKEITPIFDDRIPPEFKKDAIDNQRLLYRLEQKRMSEYQEGIR